LALLRQLAAYPEQVVPLAQLRKAAWSGVHVSSESLPRCISSLRAHLGVEDCIQTVYKRGYRLRLEVLRVNKAMESFTAGGKEHGPMQADRPARLAILPLGAAAGVPASLGANIAEAVMLRMALTRNPAIEVLARDSVFHLAARGYAAREVGAALSADLAIAGTVSALPLHYRLRTEMIRVGDSVQLWVEDFLIVRDSRENLEADAARRIEAMVLATIVMRAGTEHSLKSASVPMRAASEDSAA
jgi:TolB-like protein